MNNLNVPKKKAQASLPLADAAKSDSDVQDLRAHAFTADAFAVQAQTLTASGQLYEKLVDARVQKLHLRVERPLGEPVFFQLIFEIFAGEKIFLQLAAQENHADSTSPISLLKERPLGQQPPPAVQKLLREHLLNARLKEISWLHNALLCLEFTDVKGRSRTLFIETAKHDPRLVLCAKQSEEELEALRLKIEKKARKQKGRKAAATAQNNASVEDKMPVKKTRLFLEGQPKILLQIGESRPKDLRDVRRGKEYFAPFTEEKDTLSSERLPVANAQQPRSEKKKKKNDVFKDMRALAKGAYKKKLRLKQNLEQDLARHGDPEHHICCGEWFKMVMGQVKRGQTHVELMDFEGHPRTLILQPHLSIKENLEAFFKKAKRAKQAQAHIPKRLDALVFDLDELRQLRLNLEPERLSALDDKSQQELLQKGSEQIKVALKTSARRQAALAGKRRSWRAFRTADGVLLRVGRSAKDNDDLTFHHTPGNDWWVHSRGLPGSHVVFSSRKDAPSDSLLLDAAHLALWFSPLRAEERADVQWTQRKYVRKPAPGAPAGFVHLSRERVFHVRIDAKRVRALLDAEEPA